MVGLEIDVQFQNDTDSKKFKHLIVCFDINREKFDENINFMKSFNNFLDDNIPIMIIRSFSRAKNKLCLKSTCI